MIHFIISTTDNQYQLNENKIKRDEMFDGILATSTNAEEQ
jgi:hypothetical protein